MPSDQAMAGIDLDRRSAMALAGRFAAALALLTGPVLSSCAAPRKVVDHHPLVLTLSALTIAGGGIVANADFVIRAVESGLMGVARDLLETLSAVLDERSPGTFLKRSPTEQARTLAVLDRETFAPGVTGPMPWFATKALILMSYYTSEIGMTRNLRYELVPGRFDADVIVDKTWRPVSSDWSAVAIKGKITGR